MKFDKQLAIILVLISMLLSAVAIAVYFYQQQQQTIKKNNQLVVIYVAKNNIKKNTLIEKKHLKQTTIARQYVLNNPLRQKEIIGKYTKEAIYKNEAFLKEKLQNKIVKKEEKKKILDYKYNSYNMALKLFQNPNYSLQPNDIIKIISVYPKGEKKKNDFSVQYVTKNIRVLGFMRDGYVSDKSIIKKKIKKLVKKKQVEEIIDIKADEILLDMKQKDLLSLIDDYNKGKQLWMVKSKLEEEKKEDKKVEKKKIKDLFASKKKKSATVKKKRYYPVKWYQPKAIVSTKTAVINYADNKDLSETKKAKIRSSFTQECSKKDKLLIVVKNSTRLKEKPSFRAKTHKTVYKNYVIAYKDISKINPSWYLICDGTYINSEDVMNISYDEYKKLR